MMNLQPDWLAPTTPLRHTWQGLVNIDQFRWMVRRDTQDQLRLAHDELGARHVRAVGMFDDEMRVLGADPQSFNDPARRGKRLNWQVVDYVIESLLDMGINPMFTTTFVPSEMASGPATCFSTRSHVSPPKDYQQWAHLVSQSVKHAIERFGRQTVRQWYFEVWNEPNLRGFWDGDQADFHQLWQTTRRAIKQVDGELRVGGPSTARAEWIGDFLEFGRKHDCMPDYIIAHVYNNDSASNPLSPFEGPQADKENQSPHFAAGVVRGVRSLADSMGFKGEIHWNEWGKSWWPCFAARESEAEAAWVVKSMCEVSQLGDYFAYWCLSDIYDQVGYGAQTFHGNYGMMNLQGLRKPAWFAHQLLGMLGGQRIAAPTADDGLSGALLTRDGQKWAALLWNIAESGQDQTVRLRLPDGAGAAKLYRIGPKENNILHAWRQMGSPDYLLREQKQSLREQNLLTPAPAEALRQEGDQVEFSLSSPGVALLLG